MKVTNVLNSILCKENGEISSIKCDDATEYDDDIQIANEFNKYFIGSIIQINERIPNIPFVCITQPNENLSFRFRCVSIAEIECCLKKLKNNTDVFSINPKVLVDAINDSFIEGTFPEALKKSTIIPIQKVAGSINIGDHRPINTLTCIERLIESLAYNQFSE